MRLLVPICVAQYATADMFVSSRPTTSCGAEAFWLLQAELRNTSGLDVFRSPDSFMNMFEDLRKIQGCHKHGPQIRETFNRAMLERDGNL